MAVKRFNTPLRRLKSSLLIFVDCRKTPRCFNEKCSLKHNFCLHLTSDSFPGSRPPKTSGPDSNPVSSGSHIGDPGEGGWVDGWVKRKSKLVTLLVRSCKVTRFDFLPTPTICSWVSDEVYRTRPHLLGREVSVELQGYPH